MLISKSLSLSPPQSDFIIKIVDLKDHSVKQIKGHDAPILSLRFDPKRKYLASSSCDGSVQIWNVADLADVKNAKRFDGNHKKSNDFANSPTLCSIAWSPDGSLLAVPNDESINFYERDSWLSKFSLKQAGFASISICEFDHTGKYFAASNSTGALVVWNLNFKETPICVYVNDGQTPLTCFQFNPSNGEKLIASDKNGQLIYVDVKPNEKMVKLDREAENRYAKIEDDFDDQLDDGFDDAQFMRDLDAIQYKMGKEKELVEKENKKKAAEEEKRKESDEDDLNADFNGIEEEELAIQQREKFTESKFTTAKKRAKVFDSDEESDGRRSAASGSNALNDIDPGDLDEDIDEEDELVDIGALKQKYEAKMNASMEKKEADKANGDKNGDKNSELDSDDHKIINIKVKPIMQPAFQPGSTPEELEHRFMVWNSVGIVTCTRTETENMIDVEFHNSDVYRPIHLPNTYGYTMADLNADSLLLAAPLIENESNEEDPTASVLFCMNFNSWDSNKEWRYQVPAGESIEAAVLSANFVLIATDHRQIRLFTISGIQLHLFSVPGPIICLASQERLVQIVYHNGSGLPGEQSISMNLLKLNDRSFYPLTQLLNAPVPVCLSPKSVIDWAGFSDEGSACIVDSAGLVKLFNTNSNCWVPVADLKAKNKNDHYFVISLSEIQEQIRCIACKGSRYPATTPRPDVYSLPFEIPLCELTTSKAKLEEQLIRTSLKKRLLENLSADGFDVDFSNEENTKKQIELLIKLFALAVNADCNSLAIEVAGLMPNQLAIEGAIRYATQKNRTVLIGKLNKLSKEKFSGREMDNEEENSRASVNVGNRLTGKLAKKRQASCMEGDDDVLKPKQMKVNNEKNPFRIK